MCADVNMCERGSVRWAALIQMYKCAFLSFLICICVCVGVGWYVMRAFAVFMSPMATNVDVADIAQGCQM